MAEPYFGITDTGRVRNNNEDTFIAEPVLKGQFIAACVIDGVGGYEGGEVAAAIARESIRDYLKIPSGDIITMMREAISAANEKIFNEKTQQPKIKDMACVLTLALIDNQSNKFYYVHIGDTRLYLFRDQSLIKVTKDHSFVGFLEDSGRLSEQEAMRHPKRNEINKALGFDATIPHLTDYIEAGESPFLPGDMLLLCTDGLTDMIATKDIVSIINSNSDLVTKGEQLVMAANEAGGKDNVTVVLVENNTAPIRQKPSKPKAIQKRRATKLEDPGHIQETIVYRELRTNNSTKGNKGLVTFLSILSLLLLLACAWMLWQNKKEGGNLVTKTSVAQRNEPTQKLQDTIYGLDGKILNLSGAGFGTFIPLTDTLRIQNDSIHILGSGNTLSKDTASPDAIPVILVSSAVRYLMLENLHLQHVVINVSADNIEALHFRNVKMSDSYVRLLQDFHYADSLFTGTVAEMYLRKNDSLLINR